MYTLSELLQEVYQETGLTSSAKKTIISRLNDYQRQLCALENWVWLEDTFTITTTADTQVYSLPTDFLKAKTAYQTTNGDKYTPLKEILSPVEFDTITNLGDTTESDYPQVFHVREGNLYLWPKSSSAANTITILYLKRPVPMETEDYTTGTIAVTNGDETVTGTGTLWTTYARAGNKIQINSKWYEVASITDATHLELVKKYQGSTESGIDDYKIADVPLIPEDYQSFLWKRFCEEFYTKNKDNDKRTMYQQMRLETFQNLKKFSSSNSTTTVWPNSNGYRILDPNRYPRITVTY